MKPVAVYGGTFDPIHHGHLRTALEVGEALGAEVRMLPAHVPPMRDAPGASAAQRRRMVELAVEGVEGLTLDDRELKREGPSYMVDTLTEVRREVGAERPLCLILGTDAFARLEGWHRWRELPTLAHLVVMSRPGTPPPLEGAVAELLAQRRVDMHHELERRPAGAILLQPVSGLEISATDIRRRIHAGHDPRFLLPEAVREFVTGQRLYLQHH